VKYFQVDAFAEKIFTGNPAAVCPLREWLPAPLMQSIAAENNLAETAFFVPQGADFALRWFTPTVEVPLCGHATLASAFVLMTALERDRKRVTFHSQSGPLSVARDGDLYTLDFPARPPLATSPPPELVRAIGGEPRVWYKASYWLAVFESQTAVAALRPDFAALRAHDNVIVTAPGDTHDFVSRFFAPANGIDEDPVTGSAHCTLTPYWSQRLARPKLHARQISARGGEVWVEMRGERVGISGHAVLVKTGELHLP
jgi:predicted PhzF superfamily epimerase YddE/YHI9